MAQDKRRDFRLTPTASKDLRSLAKAGPEDVDEADAEWRSVAPPQLKELPNAVKETE